MNLNFDGVYSRNDSPFGTQVINLDKCKPLGTSWIALYVNGSNKIASYNAIYFDSFGVEHIPKEVKKSIGNRNVITNIY